MQAEFSRLISLDKIGTSEINETFEATPDELKALAKRFSVIEIEYFRLSVKVSFAKDGEYKVVGNFSSKITDESVISLKPISYTTTDSFTTVFSNKIIKNGEEFDINTEDIEMFSGDKIDVGSVAAEYLALSLDPFPHAENETFEYKEKQEQQDNPFSCLKNLKSNKN